METNQEFYYSAKYDADLGIVTCAYPVIAQGVSAFSGQKWILLEELIKPTPYFFNAFDYEVSSTEIEAVRQYGNMIIEMYQEALSEKDDYEIARCKPIIEAVNKWLKSPVFTQLPIKAI